MGFAVQGAVGEVLLFVYAGKGLYEQEDFNIDLVVLYKVFGRWTCIIQVVSKAPDFK